MRRTIASFTILVFLFMISGCATVFKGTNEEVQFHSDPQRAEVYVNGVKMGETPLTLKLESKKTYTIEFRAEGYESKTYNITNSVGAGWVILDILMGLIPVIIDAATGAWYGLSTHNVNMVLRKQQMIPFFEPF